MTTEALLATSWTTAGNAAPLRGDERSPVPLRTRIAVAAKAGFRGFGLMHGDLMAGVADMGMDGVRAALDDNGIEHRELELLTDWWADGPARRASDAVRRDLLDAAEFLGARTVKIAPDVTGGPWNPHQWAAELAALGRDAADHGTRVALEFLSRVLEPHRLLSARWNSPSPTGSSCRSCSRDRSNCSRRCRGTRLHTRRCSFDILDILHGASPPPADAAVPPWTLQLSPTELKVLRYLQTNMSRPEIARELSVSANTVSTHVRSSYAKLGADDRSGVVRRARQLRLLAGVGAGKR